MGLSKVDDTLFGDVDLNNIENTVSYITPAVGGIGPVVVSMLLRNVVESYQKMNNEYMLFSIFFCKKILFLVK